MATGDLTTLDNVKAYLGIESSFDADSLLSRLISAASKWFLRRIDREIEAPAAHTDRVDGDGGTVLYLEHRPVTEVSSVHVDGSLIPEQPATLEPGWVLISDRVELVGYAFTEGVGNVSVEYVGGEAVPEDIEQAVIELVAYRYKAKDNAGIASKSLPAGEVVAFVGYSSSTASVDAVIELYRRHSF